MTTFSGQMQRFEQAEPIVSHTVHDEYLTDLEALLRTWATIVHQDKEIAATWLRRRKPNKGRRVPWELRTRLARRTRAHARSLADDLNAAADQVARMREIHSEFVEKAREDKT